jgi:hypothetical protein
LRLKGCLISLEFFSLIANPNNTQLTNKIPFLTIELDNGKKVSKTGEIVTFTLGDGTIINLIDQSVLGMKVGEKRTIIAHNNTRNVPKNSLVIVNLDRLIFTASPAFDFVPAPV